MVDNKTMKHTSIGTIKLERSLLWLLSQSYHCVSYSLFSLLNFQIEIDVFKFFVYQKCQKYSKIRRYDVLDILEMQYVKRFYIGTMVPVMRIF